MVPFLSVIRVFWCEFFQSKVLCTYFKIGYFMVKPSSGLWFFRWWIWKKKSQFGNVLLTAKLSQLRTSCTYKIIKYENNYLSICEYQGGVGIILLSAEDATLRLFGIAQTI